MTAKHFFTDVPRSHPAYKLVNRMEKAGIIVFPTICYPSERGWRYDMVHRTFGRYEFAVIAQRAQARLAHPDSDLQNKTTLQKRTALRRDVARLAVIFRPELRELSR